MLPIDE
jgi:hypothetical protein